MCHARKSPGMSRVYLNPRNGGCQLQIERVFCGHVLRGAIVDHSCCVAVSGINRALEWKNELQLQHVITSQNHVSKFMRCHICCKGSSTLQFCQGVCGSLPLLFFGTTWPWGIYRWSRSVRRSQHVTLGNLRYLSRGLSVV